MLHDLFLQNLNFVISLIDLAGHLFDIASSFCLISFQVLYLVTRLFQFLAHFTND